MQKEILAMKTANLALRTRLKKEWWMPRMEGKIVRNMPKMKRGLERAL